MFTTIFPRRIRKKLYRDGTILPTTSAKPSTPPPSLDNISTDLKPQPSTSSTLDDSQHHAAHKPLINPRLISDATIGLSDGLTVPFALTAGLTALGDTRTVIYGGLAELIAGAISMGLGGYLGARGESAAYEESRSRLVATLLLQDQPAGPTKTAATTTTTTAVIDALQRGLFPLRVPAEILQQQVRENGEKEEWVGLLLRLQGISLPCTSSSEETTAASDDDESGGGCKRRRRKQRRDDGRVRAVKSAVTIAAGYFLGGLLPLIPYFFVAGHVGRLLTGLYISIGVMGVALFTFGYVKTGVVVGFERRHSSRCMLGGVQMVVVGGMAAGAAMGLVKGFEGVGTFGS
ncbi:VIT family-domain-containing protein [Triangularia verruculosa]|uniref:VIT family-domain-containing protein n=1 Tax=Triangularia verruculosa TaxID=2587418 RepID=A0AAN6XFF6_9PEZI|nr:VIT family-domain-containing protein [Triangularia verruculosa]